MSNVFLEIKVRNNQIENTPKIPHAVRRYPPLKRFRRASVSRELTKIYEETVRGTLGNLITHFTTGFLKGEFVLVVEGKKG